MLQADLFTLFKLWFGLKSHRKKIYNLCLNVWVNSDCIDETSFLIFFNLKALNYPVNLFCGKLWDSSDANIFTDLGFWVIEVWWSVFHNSSWSMVLDFLFGLSNCLSGVKYVILGVYLFNLFFVKTESTWSSFLGNFVSRWLLLFLINWSLEALLTLLGRSFDSILFLRFFWLLLIGYELLYNFWLLQDLLKLLLTEILKLFNYAFINLKAF